MITQDENRDSVHTSAFDPFPQPQTIPAGWDLSELLSAPPPAPAVDEENASDS